MVVRRIALLSVVFLAFSKPAPGGTCRDWLRARLGARPSDPQTHRAPDPGTLTDLTLAESDTQAEMAALPAAFSNQVEMDSQKRIRTLSVSLRAPKTEVRERVRMLIELLGHFATYYRADGVRSSPCPFPSVRIAAIREAADLYRTQTFTYLERVLILGYLANNILGDREEHRNAHRAPDSPNVSLVATQALDAILDCEHTDRQLLQELRHRLRNTRDHQLDVEVLVEVERLRVRGRAFFN